LAKQGLNVIRSAFRLAKKHRWPFFWDYKVKFSRDPETRSKSGGSGIIRQFVLYFSTGVNLHSLSSIGRSDL